MIAVGQGAAIGELVGCAMDEFMIGEPGAGQPDDAVMCDLAQRQDELQIGQRIQGFRQIRAAIADFGPGRLVVRRETFDGVEDDRSVQSYSIGRIIAKISLNQAIFGHGGEKHRARGIAREGSARAIGAFLAWRKSDYGQRSVGIPKSGNGSIPPIGMTLAERMAQPNQPSTAAAFHRGTGKC